MAKEQTETEVIITVDTFTNEWNRAALCQAIENTRAPSRRKSICPLPPAGKPELETVKLSTNEWNTLALSRIAEAK